MKFSNKGHLEPATKIIVNLEDFKTTFVVNFEENSKTRGYLYVSLLHFLEDFKNEITSSFSVWINGSFVTKTLNPNDIDLVLLIDYQVYINNEKIIEDKFTKNKGKHNYEGLDMYRIIIYPENHPKSFIFQSDCAYWTEQFSATRKDRNGKKYNKGFVEIHFN